MSNPTSSPASIKFIGAAQTVTGSKHLLSTAKSNVLLDCGLFQGRRQEAWQRNSELPLNPTKIDAVVLSHAHIDHSGALPYLVKMGYDGPIYCTPATRDLAAPMLLDTAFLLKSDAEHIDKLLRRGAKDLEPVEPLYDENDVLKTLEQMISLPYHRQHGIAPGLSLKFYNAGHVLGSAISLLSLSDSGLKTRIAYTGDLGRSHMPILKDPEVPSGVHHLIMESTYGDRLHGSMENLGAQLAEVINRAYQRGGKIIIPSFALERAQELIYTLKLLRRDGKIPKLPVYVDSPLTFKVTEVFKLHPECYDRDTYQHIKGHDSPFDFPGLTYIDSVEDSKRLDMDNQPAVIISASGMCEGGRVLHHLRAAISHMANTILIVGFQAEHTLGRRIAEQREEVKIFGMYHQLNAEVIVLDSLSAHADQNDLVNFAQAVKENGQLSQIILVHGEQKQQMALKEKLEASGHSKVFNPQSGERIELSGFEELS